MPDLALSGAVIGSSTMSKLHCSTSVRLISTAARRLRLENVKEIGQKSVDVRLEAFVQVEEILYAKMPYVER